MADKKELTPSEYFEIVKSRKQTVTDDQLIIVYDNCLELLNKYKITGQKSAMKKLLFHLETVDKEREIVKMGIDTFVYKDDIEEYINDVANDTIKIIELENYEREIPDEIVHIIEKVKDKFDQLYILFTDYTGKMERKVEKERRQKDPILFGTFQSSTTKTVIDRFYFLGDWEDEYCDLTLDKMVSEMGKIKKRDITRTISTPKDIEELKQQLNYLSNSAVNDGIFKMVNKKKFTISQVKTFLTRGKQK